MDLKTDIENLIDSISSIEDRHFLEVLAVYDGLKKVMRIHINLKEEYEILLSFAKKYNLYLNHTPFKLKIDWTNEIGDTFLKSVPWDDESTEMFVAYISKDEKSNKIAETIEVDSTNLEAGLLYQYPSCCCVNYDKISEGELWLNLLLENSKGIKFSPWANKLSYLVYEFCLFPDYFPCNLSCEGTIQLSKDYYKLAEKYKLDHFAKKQFDNMSGLYLVNDNCIIATKEFMFSDSNIKINLSNATSYNISENLIDVQIVNNEFNLQYKNDNAYIIIENQEFRIIIFE